MDLDARARQRRAELWLGIAWYGFSALVTTVMTTANSALSVLPGYEQWAVWTGRFALIPFLLALAGVAWLFRGPIQARAVVDALLAPPVRRREAMLVFAASLVLPSALWMARPGIGPGILGFTLVWGTFPLLWSALRARSAAWRWLVGLSAFAAVQGLVLLGLRWRLGPVDQVTGPELTLLLWTLGGIAVLGLTLSIGMLVLVGIGFWRVDRAFDRGDLDTVAATSFAGLLEDHILVLDAMRRQGRTDEVVERFLRSVSSMPMTGNSLAVVARALHDAGDPRAPALAVSAFEAQPTSPAALLTLGLVHLGTDPGLAIDAAETALARALGGGSRRGVFEALEIAALYELGHDVSDRLRAYDPPEHPVHAGDAVALLQAARDGLDAAESQSESTALDAAGTKKAGGADALDAADPGSGTDRAGRERPASEAGQRGDDDARQGPDVGARRDRRLQRG